MEAAPDIPGAAAGSGCDPAHEDQHIVGEVTTHHRPLGGHTRQASISSTASKPQDTDKRDRNRRTAPRLPQAAVRILETWLIEHRDTPYVSAYEQDQLKARTGLRRSQIKTWFANARKRRRVESLVRPSTGLPFVLSSAENEPYPPLFRKGEQPGANRSPTGPSHFDTKVFPQLSGLDPFVRWLLLGPEHEPATVQAIHEAIREKEEQRQKAATEASPSAASPASSGGNKGQSNDDVEATNLTTGLAFAQPAYKVVKRTRSQRSWPSSLEIRSYAANKFSVASDEWKPSVHAAIRTAASVIDGDGSKSVDYVAPSKPARRHRRSEPSLAGSSVRGVQRALSLGGQRLPALKDETQTTSNGNNNSNRRFQCTFCADAFVKRHDWQRHEKSQHLALEWWTCCPNDGLAATHVDPLTSTVTCVFCGIRDPDREHLDQQHGLAACAARSEAERTFYRKDHLRQHLRLMHADSTFTPAMEAWKTELVEVKSRCGFCVDIEFDTWPARVSHLAAHFRAGISMDQWKGDWGLEDGVKENLERATLPADRVAAAAVVDASVSPHAPPASTQAANGTVDFSWANLDSPMADVPEGSLRFDSPSAYVPLAPESIMSDNTAGMTWDLSLLDFDTLTNVGGLAGYGGTTPSVLDALDNYSLSAASAMDFFGQDQLGHSQLQHHFLHQPYHQQQQPFPFTDTTLPLATPPIPEDTQFPFLPPEQAEGYDGPASALLDFASMPLVESNFAQQQHQPQRLFNTENFLGVPAYDITFDEGNSGMNTSAGNTGLNDSVLGDFTRAGEQQQAEDALTAFLQQHFEGNGLPDYPKRCA